jgi:hypothetical protein
MASTTSDDLQKVRTVALVHVESGSGTAIALTEEDSIEFEFNEENEDFNPGTTTRTTVLPSNEDPKVNVTVARGVDQDALEEFGITDSSGNYERGDSRTWNTLELWAFTQDDTIDSANADAIDVCKDVRWDIGSIEEDGSKFLYDMTGHIQGDITLDGSTNIT